MTKGTTSQGPRNDKTHTFCRRCGRRTLHRQTKRCAACGFPGKKMRRYDGTNCKVRTRKGQGSGRMKYLKDVPRRFRNHFREENVIHRTIPAQEKQAKKVFAKIPQRKLH